MLMKYSAQRQDIEEAKKLALELLQEIDLNLSPAVLQEFAKIAIDLDPSIAQEVINLCLWHQEIPGR